MFKGERLKKIRIDHNLTQSELAGILGLKKSTICTYEKERRDPASEVLKKCAEYFGVTTDYLLGIDTLVVKEDSAPFNYMALTKEELEFIKLLRKEKMIYDILINNPQRGMDLIKRKIG